MNNYKISVYIYTYNNYVFTYISCALPKFTANKCNRRAGLDLRRLLLSKAGQRAVNQQLEALLIITVIPTVVANNDLIQITVTITIIIERRAFGRSSKGNCLWAGRGSP